MTTQGKSLLKKLLIAVAIVVAILLVLPRFIDVDRYRPEAILEIERLTARPVEMGRISIRFLPRVSLVIHNLALGNPPGFPAGKLVTATKVSANLELGPLLHRHIVVDSVEVDQPVIHLLSSGTQWNFANPPRAAVRNAAFSQDGMAFQASVGEVVISGAHMTLAHVLESGEVSAPVLEAMDARMDLKSITVGAVLAPTVGSPDGLRQGIPWRLVSLGNDRPLPESGWGLVAAQGTLSAKVLRYDEVSLTNLKSNLRLDAATLSLSPISFDLYSGRGGGEFHMDLARADSPYQISLNLSGVDVAQLLAAFPGGGGKVTGRLKATCNFLGDFAGDPNPWAGKQAEGSVTILKGELPEIKLNKSILQMAKIAGLGPTSGKVSSFSSLSADFELRNGLLTSRKIVLAGNGLNANGEGSTDLNRARALNYQGVAEIKATASPLTSALSSLMQIPIRNGMVELPFQVNGLLAHPNFVVQPPGGPGNAKGLAPSPGQAGSGHPQNSPNNLIQGIMGWFGKGTKPSSKQ